MYKKILLSTVLASSLYASTYTMYAKQVDAYDDRVIASGSVVIYHEGSVYKAKKAIYERKNKLLRLIDDVTVITPDSTLKSDSVAVKLDKDKTVTGNFFIFDTTSKMWLRGDKYYENTKDIHIVKDSEISSCDIKDPDWKILFHKAEFDKKHEFIYLTRPTFYFKNVPVFGLPWFAFPTVKKRKTGLLRPEFGFDNETGFVFKQPYFYAPAQNWDMDIIPQIRTKRGYGLYTNLNFVDTRYSRGKITLGKFYDKDSFYEEKNLKNKSHYGFDIKYTNRKFFDRFLKKDSYKDGLWLDFHYLNDIDYENLKDVTVRSLNKLVTSRFNYFFKRDRDYLGFYIKYFLDSDKDNNDDTLQELPTLQYHKFTTNLPLKNLTYSVDYKMKNNYRKKGLNATLHEINLPVKFDMPLMKNYLNFSISENLYYNKINYSKRDRSLIRDLEYFSNYHKFILSSDLIKSYDEVVHNLQLEASLQVPSFEDKDGDMADFISINKEEKNLKLSANQYFYNHDEFNFLTLRTQTTTYLDRTQNRYEDLFNEIIYNYSSNLKLQENITYSREYKKITQVQSNIDFNDEFYRLNLSHTYKNIPDKDKVSYITAKLDLKLYHGYGLNFKTDYDAQNKLTRSWSTKLFRYKKCWNYSIKYKESITPIFTSGGVRSYKNKGLYFLVNFANIGGISYEYTKEDVSDGLE